jgi:hypothetical protein
MLPAAAAARSRPGLPRPRPRPRRAHQPGSADTATHVPHAGIAPAPHTNPGAQIPQHAPGPPAPSPAHARRDFPGARRPRSARPARGHIPAGPAPPQPQPGGTPPRTDTHPPGTPAQKHGCGSTVRAPRRSLSATADWRSTAHGAPHRAHRRTRVSPLLARRAMLTLGDDSRCGARRPGHIPLTRCREFTAPWTTTVHQGYPRVAWTSEPPPPSAQRQAEAASEPATEESQRASYR